jgi:CheY-like chemotaxis protein/predicted Ser/Thr protein kinase
MSTSGTMLAGRYRLDEHIGGGGMGDVWRGTDTVLGRTVAIKMLRRALLDQPGFAERFLGEARAMATINHAGVAHVHDYGSGDGTAFLVMEYVDGDPLSRTLRDGGPLAPARAMELVAQAAYALQAAHDKGIVHRDVKPDNLLVRSDGRLVLTDFGIARSAIVGPLTAAGAVLGSVSYLSPEQVAGQAATPLSDVYALGVVAYECLAGRRPFEGTNPVEVAMLRMREVPPPLPAEVPPAVRRVVETAMAREPGMRYASAAAMATAARQAVAERGAATTAVPAPGHAARLAASLLTTSEARMPDRIRVLVVDDHALVREALAMLLDAQPGIEVVGQAANGEEALRRAAEVGPDVVLMDLRMPVLDGVATTRRMRTEQPGARVIALTTSDEDEDVFAVLRAGAVGYLLKDVVPSRLVEAVLAAARGESVLQPSIAAKLVARFAENPAEG